MAYAGSAALQKGIGFALFLWLAHSLSVEAYALFGLLLALQAGLSGLAGAGIFEAVIGLLKECRTTASRVQLFHTANGVFAAQAIAAVGIVALIYSVLLRDTEASMADAVFIIAGGVVTAFFTFQAKLTRLEEDHSSSLALAFIPPLAGWVAAFAAFLLLRTVSSFFIGLAIGLLVCLVPFRHYGIGHYGYPRDIKATRPIVARLAPFVLIVILAWLSGYGSTYLIKSFFTATDVARFTFAYTLSSIMQLVASSLNQVWGPRFLRVVHELPVAEVERRNRRFFALEGIALGATGGLVLAVLSSVTQVVGASLSAYQDLTIELLLLFGAYAISIPWYHVQNYYLAYGKGIELMNVSLLTSIAGLLLWIGAIALLGVVGVYAGFVLLMFTRMFGAVVWARRTWAVRILWEGPVLALVLLGLGALASAPLTKLLS
jgi:O-antigen/teichoic acid export membrane protein